MASGQVTGVEERGGQWVVHIEQELRCGERLVAQASSELRLGQA